MHYPLKHFLVTIPGNTGLDCNFEKGWCTYTTNSSARFSFRKHKGQTASAGTGPHYDHTYGNSSGSYVYAEASSPALANDTTQLTSGEMPAFGAPGKCLSFWYHMYGPHVGTLRVLSKVLCKFLLPPPLTLGFFSLLLGGDYDHAKSGYEILFKQSVYCLRIPIFACVAVNF